MLQNIEGAAIGTIAIEILGGYSREDEKTLEALFEQLLDQGHEKVNLLVRIDHIDITATSWRAMWNDGIYALKHIRHCGRIAVVGNSHLEKMLVSWDNAIFGKPSAGRIERYFDVAQQGEALFWVNGD